MSTERALQQAVDAATGRAAAWLWSMQAPGRPKGVLRVSAAHDPQAWPGVLLAGTYDGVMCLAMLGEIAALSEGEREEVASFLASHRRADGVFVNPDMVARDTFKKTDAAETARYIAFHLTNYGLGAMEMLGALGRPNLRFIEPYLDPQGLLAWLGARDLRDPWQEGNNAVNLASFLLLARDLGDARAERVLRLLLDWHARHQEPATGFWGVGQTVDAERHLQAMAGATHNLHLYYALGEPVPYHERMVDYGLTLPTGATTACLDVDPIDILIHMDRLYGYRRPEVHAWLRAKLQALLGFQNDDGGFSDAHDGTRRLDGWVGGYAEPQGLSNGFATFFRCLAIAMISDCLWPGWRQWRFRPMIGMGYVYTGRYAG